MFWRRVDERYERASIALCFFSGFDLHQVDGQVVVGFGLEPVLFHGDGDVAVAVRGAGGGKGGFAVVFRRVEVGEFDCDGGVYGEFIGVPCHYRSMEVSFLIVLLGVWLNHTVICLADVDRLFVFGQAERPGWAVVVDMADGHIVVFRREGIGITRRCGSFRSSGCRRC